MNPRKHSRLRAYQKRKRAAKRLERYVIANWGLPVTVRAKPMSARVRITDHSGLIRKVMNASLTP